VTLFSIVAVLLFVSVAELFVLEFVEFAEPEPVIELEVEFEDAGIAVKSEIGIEGRVRSPCQFPKTFKVFNIKFPEVMLLFKKFITFTEEFASPETTEPVPVL